jgi:hypothetical protein
MSKLRIRKTLKKRTRRGTAANSLINANTGTFGLVRAIYQGGEHISEGHKEKIKRRHANRAKTKRRLIRNKGKK